MRSDRGRVVLGVFPPARVAEVKALSGRIHDYGTAKAGKRPRTGLELSLTTAVPLTPCRRGGAWGIEHGIRPPITTGGRARRGRGVWWLPRRGVAARNRDRGPVDRGE